MLLNLHITKYSAIGWTCCNSASLGFEPGSILAFQDLHPTNVTTSKLSKKLGCLVDIDQPGQFFFLNYNSLRNVSKPYIVFQFHTHAFCYVHVGAQWYKKAVDYEIWVHCYLEHARKPSSLYPPEFEVAATAILECHFNVAKDDISLQIKFRTDLYWFNKTNEPLEYDGAFDTVNWLQIMCNVPQDVELKCNTEINTRSWQNIFKVRIQRESPRSIIKDTYETSSHINISTTSSIVGLYAGSSWQQLWQVLKYSLRWLRLGERGGVL